MTGLFVAIYTDSGNGTVGLESNKTLKSEYGADRSDVPTFAVAAAVNHTSSSDEVFLVDWDLTVYHYLIFDTTDPPNCRYLLLASFKFNDNANAENVFNPNLANDAPIPVDDVHALTFLDDAVFVLCGTEVKIMNMTTREWSTYQDFGILLQ